MNQLVFLLLAGAAFWSTSQTPISAESGTNRGAVEPVDAYFPAPESAGGWRKLDNPEEIRRITKIDPAKLDALKEWLLQSDDRNFAADVIRHGYIVLEVERGNSARTDTRRVASVSKAICATVLAIASEEYLRRACSTVLDHEGSTNLASIIMGSAL